MSGSISPTVAAPPTAVQASTSMLALMAGLSGVVTDYNAGSQVRTQAESLAAILEMQGVGAVATVLQGAVYGAMALFGVIPGVATAATGFVTFATAFPLSGAPAAPQPIGIPVNTLVQTAGGTVFATTASGLLVSGATNVIVPITAQLAGAAGNVAASGITGQSLTAIGYPLFVQNSNATAGGQAAAQLSQTLAQFTAKAGSLGLASPYAIANACIGVTASGSAETVAFAATYEPWISAGSGAGSGQAGFTVFVDNGTGSASPGLLSAVTSFITGSVASGQSGYRPAGVPFGVSGVVPVNATLVVSGVLNPGFANAAAASSGATANVQAYFSSLPFYTPALQPQLSAAVANAALGYFSALTVTLSYSSASGVSVPAVSGTGLPWRVILNSLNLIVGY